MNISNNNGLDIKTITEDMKTVMIINGVIFREGDMVNIKYSFGSETEFVGRIDLIDAIYISIDRSKPFKKAITNCFANDIIDIQLLKGLKKIDTCWFCSKSNIECTVTVLEDLTVMPCCDKCEAQMKADAEYVDPMDLI